MGKGTSSPGAPVIDTGQIGSLSRQILGSAPIKVVAKESTYQQWYVDKLSKANITEQQSPANPNATIFKGPVRQVTLIAGKGGQYKVLAKGQKDFVTTDRRKARLQAQKLAAGATDSDYDHYRPN